MAYGTRSEGSKLGPQTERDANRFIDCRHLILAEHLNQYISSPMPHPLSSAPCWQLGSPRSAPNRPDSTREGLINSKFEALTTRISSVSKVCRWESLINQTFPRHKLTRCNSTRRTPVGGAWESSSQFSPCCVPLPRRNAWSSKASRSNQ
jgi:hypothetical protein